MFAAAMGYNTVSPTTLIASPGRPMFNPSFTLRSGVRNRGDKKKDKKAKCCSN